MTEKTPLLSVALAAVLVLIGRLAWADHWHDDHGHWKKHALHRGDDEDDREVDRREHDCYFQPHDVRLIAEYYAPQDRSLPPGLAKKYYRTGQLPPGWQKKLQPLPVVVERQLVVLPREYRRGVVDGYAVVYDRRTQVVIDVVCLFGQ